MFEDRLFVLAAFLRTVPATSFDFRTFVQNLPVNEDTDPWTCGFSGCAIGWCAFVPEFKAFGVYLRREKRKPWSVLMPGSDCSEDTAQMLFGLDDDELHFLFFPLQSRLGEKATPTEVADHIEAFVKSQGRTVWGAIEGY